MEFKSFRLLVGLMFLNFAWALPSSMVEEIKNNEMKNNKVKRAESNHEEKSAGNGNNVNYFKPPVSKRGKVMLPQILPPPSYQDFYNIQSGLYSSDYPIMDEKTLQNYDNGLQYGPYNPVARDQLDEALENAILKGEIYGDPMRQYRLKREAIRSDIELTPEEALALLELYESNVPNKESDNYRKPWTRYGPGVEQPESQDFNLPEDTWLDGPVYPHATLNNIDSNYLYDFDVPPQYEARGKWSRFSDVAPANKRFFSKRRANDPTQMVRYLNGPNENDFDTLSRIFNTKKEQQYNTPMYRPVYL